MDNSTLPTLLNTADHDLLITVNANLNSLIARFDSYQIDVINRIAKTENRLDQMDVYHAAIPLKDYQVGYQYLMEEIKPTWKEHQDDHKWISNLRANMIGLSVVGGAAVVILSGLIGNLIGKWLNLK